MGVGWLGGGGDIVFRASSNAGGANGVVEPSPVIMGSCGGIIQAW